MRLICIERGHFCVKVITSFRYMQITPEFWNAVFLSAQFQLHFPLSSGALFIVLFLFVVFDLVATKAAKCFS